MSTEPTTEPEDTDQTVTEPPQSDVPADQTQPNLTRTPHRPWTWPPSPPSATHWRFR